MAAAALADAHSKFPDFIQGPGRPVPHLSRGHSENASLIRLSRALVCALMP